MELVPLSPPASPDSSDHPAADEFPPETRPEAVAAQIARPAPRIEVDAFLARAAAEYRQGRIDQPLWDQTAREFDGNKQATVSAYLRVRARALKRQHRDEEAQKAVAAAAPKRGLSAMLAKPRMRYGLAGVAIGFTAVIAAWFAFSGDAEEPVAQAAASTPKPVVAPKVEPSKPAPISQASATPARSDAALELEGRVRGLEQAANWNVLVLYAAEWTRKEPGNAAAWTSLSNGYLRLRQWDDALDAAKNAVKAAPGEAGPWRNLGHVEIALERWPEARNAFDKSLAVKGDDLDALCGAALVASADGRPKDAAEFAARVARAGTGCPDAGNVVRAAAVGTTARKPAAAR